NSFQAIWGGAVAESRGKWLRLSVLAVLVLAVHLWLLGGLPRVVTPAKQGTTFIARNVTPPAPSPPQAAAPAVEHAPATRPAAKPIPAQTVPKTPEVAAVAPTAPAA